MHVLFMCITQGHTYNNMVYMSTTQSFHSPNSCGCSSTTADEWPTVRILVALKLRFLSRAPVRRTHPLPTQADVTSQPSCSCSSCRMLNCATFISTDTGYDVRNNDVQKAISSLTTRYNYLHRRRSFTSQVTKTSFGFIFGTPSTDGTKRTGAEYHFNTTKCGIALN